MLINFSYTCWQLVCLLLRNVYSDSLPLLGVFCCWVQFSSLAQSCLTLCDPMDCSTPGFPVHHQLPELTQTHSGSRSVITPSWLSASWRSFLYSSSVYSCHLFLISSASVRSIPFLSFIEPIIARNVPLLSLTFLKRSLVFPILLLSSLSLHWSLRKAFLYVCVCV